MSSGLENDVSDFGGERFVNNSSSKEVAYLRSRMTLVHHLRRKLVPRSLSRPARNPNHQGKHTNREGSGRLQISQELRSFAEYGIMERLQQNFRCQRIQLQIWFRREECLTCKLFRTHVKPSSFFWQDAWDQFAPFALPQILPWARQSLIFVRTILCSSGCVSWTLINLWPNCVCEIMTHFTSRQETEVVGNSVPVPRMRAPKRSKADPANPSEAFPGEPHHCNGEFFACLR